MLNQFELGRERDFYLHHTVAQLLSQIVHNDAPPTLRPHRCYESLRTVVVYWRKTFDRSVLTSVSLGSTHNRLIKADSLESCILKMHISNESTVRAECIG